MERKRKKAERDKRHNDRVKAAGGRDAYREQRAQAAEEARGKQTTEEAAAEAKLMKRKRKHAESQKLHRVKLNAAGGRNAWAQLQEQRAEAAEEARSKQTAEEAELEAKRMEKKRKDAESAKRRRAKVKLLSPLVQTTRLLQLEQRAQAAEEELAFSLSQPKQTAEHAALEALALTLRRWRAAVKLVPLHRCSVSNARSSGRTAAKMKRSKVLGAWLPW
jgi:hypothetical protein